MIYDINIDDTAMKQSSTRLIGVMSQGRTGVVNDTEIYHHNNSHYQL